MKIKVLRDYSGEEGTDPDKNVQAGSEHIVTRARGNALFANGLVVILEDEADATDGADGTGESEGYATMQNDAENKQAQAPANKQAPTSKNKAAGTDQAQA
jgi:hypothetical protein